MRIGIVGASGFIGKNIANVAVKRGHEVVGFSRSERAADALFSEWRTAGTIYDLIGVDALINLAGESVNQRWTDAKKAQFRQSRVGVTENLLHSISLMTEDRPKCLINASGIGIYGNRGDEILTEISDRGFGYLADLCEDWENAAFSAKEHGLRVAVMRIGMVLGKEGDAFRQLHRVFKLGLGGRLGSGMQWMSWIHVQDLAAAFLHVIENEEISGIINGVAPNPETNVHFTKKFAASVRRPAFFPVPAFALNLILGEFGKVVTESLRVQPEILATSGFSFAFPSLETALEDLVV